MVLLLLALEILAPVFDYPHLTALHREGVFGNVLGDCRTCGGGCVFPYLNGSDKICVAADKGIIADNGSVLIHSVIVCGYTAAAEVYSLSDVAVTNVGKMCNCCIYADFRVLDFNKIAYLYSVVESCAGTDMYEGTCLYPVTDFCGISLNAV